MFVFRRLAVLLILWWAPSVAWAGGGRLEVWFLDVGEGDSAYVSTPSGRTILIDGGPREAAGRVAGFVASHSAGPLDVVVLTHPHADHFGGLLAALQVHGLKAFFDPALEVPRRPAALARLYSYIALRGVEAHRVRAGATRPIDFGDGVRLEFLSPRDPLVVDSRADLNANSVVCVLTFGQFRVLFAADAENVTEQRLLEHRDQLRATVLKVPHHGAQYSSSPAFLAAVRPEVAVISTGAGNEYGHPHPITLRRLETVKARIYRTDVSGTVQVVADGDSYSVSIERGVGSPGEYAAPGD